MIEEDATVIAIDGEQVLVEVERRSSCDSCQAKNGCGTAVLRKVVGNKRSQLLVKRDRDLKVGDRLVLGLEEKALVKGSLAVYFVPLLLMIFFAILGVSLAGQLTLKDPDGASMLFALFGLGLGMAWLKFFSHRIAADKQYQPIILRVVF